MAGKATPGEEYIVKSGDTLQSIAAQAFGDSSKWKVLWNALARDKRNKNPDWIYPGQKILIPMPTSDKEDAKSGAIIGENTEPVAVQDKPKGIEKVIGASDFFIDIGGLKVMPISGRFFSGADVAARSWTGRFVWTPNSSSHFDAQKKRRTASGFNDTIKSGSFTTSKCYIKGECVGTGFLKSRSYNISPDEATVDCEFYSNTGHMVDSDINPNQTMQATIMDKKGLSLAEITKLIVANYMHPGKDVLGMTADAGFIKQYDKDLNKETKEEYKFKFSAARVGSETVIKFIQRLAAQRGIFVTDDELGNLVLHKIPNQGATVATIQYGAREHESISATYDDSYLFAHYIGYTQSDGNGQASRKDQKAEIKRVSERSYKNVPENRVKVYEAPDLTGSAIADATDWLISKAYLDSHSFILPVHRLTDDSGNLWRHSTLIQLKSPVLEDDDFHLMVIRSVEYIISGAETTVNLTVFPAFVLKDGKLAELKLTAL